MCARASNAVQLSAAAHAAALAGGMPPEQFVPFGERAVKGKGLMRTFLLREGAWEAALAAAQPAPAGDDADT